MSFSLRSPLHLFLLRNSRAFKLAADRTNIFQSRSQRPGSLVPLGWQSSAFRRFHIYHAESSQSASPSKESEERISKSITPISKKAPSTPQTPARQGKPVKTNPISKIPLQYKLDLSEQLEMATSSDRSHLTHSERTAEEPRDEV